MVVLFTKDVGEIPNGSIGFFRFNPILGAEDRTRVCILRSCVHIGTTYLPVYDMAASSAHDGTYVEVDESGLAEEQRSELQSLRQEFDQRENLYVGNGVLVSTLGVCLDSDGHIMEHTPKK